MVYLVWGRERLLINRQDPLLPGQRQRLPRARAKSLALHVHTLVHPSLLKLILKKSSGTLRSFTVKLSPLNNVGVHTRSQLIQITVRKPLQILPQNEGCPSMPSHYTYRYRSLPLTLSLAQPQKNSIRTKQHELQSPRAARSLSVFVGFSRNHAGNIYKCTEKLFAA